MNPPSQSHDQGRRISGGSGSPVFPGQHEQSAPPTLGTRQMPPPSPPQHYPSRGQSGSASHHALSNPFLSREPPSNPAHRPGSSMSISAMLGSDADRPPRDVGSSSIFSRLPVSSAPFASAPPQTAPGAMSPPTAPARTSSLEYPLFRRSQTPETSFAKSQSARPYRSSSGGVPQPPVSAGLSRPPLTSQPTHPSPQMSTADSYNEHRRLSFNGPIPRPNSQPQHIDPSARPSVYSPLSRPAPGLAEGSLGVAQQRPPSYLGLESQHSRFGGLYGERQAEEQAHRERERERERERIMAHEAEARAAHHQPARYGSHYGEREAGASRHPSASTWEMGRSQPPSPESKRFPAPEPGSGFGFGAIQSYTKSLGSQMGGSRQPSLSMQPRQGQPTPPPSEQPYLSRLQTEQPRIFASTPSAGPSPLIHSAPDDQRRKGSDELFHHRNLLAVGAEGKRGGRASPLPQAVQGAQAQIMGPAGETGIKNELGRVFSGIGSGVGGVTAPTAVSGPSTPMTASPFKREGATARSTNSETTTDETKIGRPGSTTGKRSRKSREDEGQLDGETGGSDSRLGTSTRGRRGRHVHHHHHHSHHHHRHKADEEAAHRSLPSMNPFHRTSTPAEAAAPGTAGHHHHHHHHHHHAPRPAMHIAASPMREPRTVVNIEPVLSNVAHLPRHHLGSTLYAPRIGVPTSKATLESAKFGYTTTPLPLPRFEGRENCTFTIRVPRFRIDTSHREEICARRALWGTGIYTDDSDPVAAAIHSGFIRGAWGEDVDETMLDLEIRDTYQHAPKSADEMSADSEATAGERPRVPPATPSDKDLHITLQILPKLEQYESSVIFGLKSRPWDGMHDGMSFRVLRVEWVEEGVGRGEERNGEARRKRLRNLMQTGRICTGPGVVKLEQLRKGVIEVPRRKIGMDNQERSAPVQTVS
ncbi:hypothetical protein MW887_000565 [Aspergillus wentii]|nr:hypothetical protein MW887_000565 [Aspergillus wentii]